MLHCRVGHPAPDPLGARSQSPPQHSPPHLPVHAPTTQAPAPPGEVKTVILRCVGGEIGAASSLAPKVGPMGLVRVLFLLLPFLLPRPFFFVCGRAPPPPFSHHPKPHTLFRARSPISLAGIAVAQKGGRGHSKGNTGVEGHEDHGEAHGDQPRCHC